MTKSVPANQNIPVDQTIRSGTVAERVYGELHDAILEQRLAPGTKLTEDALGEIFGLSRTVVRKALIRLAHENLVEMRPNRGAIVASPSVEEAADVFEARRVIEGAIIRKLCGEKRLKAPAIARLRELVEQERDAHEADDRALWIRLSGGFHLELAAMAGNRVLTEDLDGLVSRTSLIISLYERPGHSACSFEEHEALIRALADGDAETAVALMDDHLAACEQKLDIGHIRGKPDLAAIFAPSPSGT